MASIGGIYTYTGSSSARNSWEKGFLLAFLSVSDYTPLDTNLYFIITNFHPELKPLVMIGHGINSPAFTLYTTFD